MPELLGKTADGKTCVLKVEDGEVTLSYEKGFMGKSLVKETGFRLSQTLGVRVETGVKPYTSSAKLTVGYLQEGKEMELSVFSRGAEKVEELRVLVDADIRRRREALDDVLKEFRETREAQLNHLQLDMELAESLFVLLEGLHGRVDWVRVRETLEQVERIEAERESLNSAPVARLGFEGLRNLLSRRHPEELKAEVADALDTLYRGVSAASRHSPRWFNRRVSYLVVEALYRAWDGRIVEVLGEGPWGGDDAFSQVVGELREVVLGETGVSLPEPQSFEGLRHTLYEAIDLLLGMELNLDITSLDLE
ncbi:MAG: hypothetical protein ABIJ47_10195 [Candidatus Bathyarchaeota archaeon]